MKKITSLSNKHFLSIWIFYHAIIILAFLFSLVRSGGRISMDADLFNMLPKPVASKALAMADEKLTEMTGDNMFILVSHQDFAAARRAAVSLYEKLSVSDKFKSVELYQDMAGMEETLEFVSKNRLNLLGDQDIELLESEGGPEIFCENALSRAYGAFTMTSLSSLDEDPFMLGESALENYLSYLQSAGTSMSIKEDVLAAYGKPYSAGAATESEPERWYVMIRAALSKKGSALASKSNGVQLIMDSCEEISRGGEVSPAGEDSPSQKIVGAGGNASCTGEISPSQKTTSSAEDASSRPDDGLRFIFSGTPFHSYTASSKASFEITLISIVSLAAVLIVLLFVFRTPLPIFCSLLSIGVSVGAAFMAVISIFGKMHVLTLVFGTSLIGSCIDYSLHYFINWKAAKNLLSGSEIRAHLFKGLSLSLLSTVLCYFVLFFAPFALLRQISLFSISGILSTFLTAVCIYPLIPLPKDERKLPFKMNHFHKSDEGKLTESSKKGPLPRAVNLSRFIKVFHKKSVRMALLAGLFVFFGGILVFKLAGKLNFSLIENNLGRLYKLEGKEFQDEAEASQILKYSPGAWFIVSGETVEKVLENEEKITSALRKINSGKENGGYICTSGFIPSLEQQKKSREAAKKLLPYAENQFEMLGYSQKEAEYFSQKLEASFDEGEKSYIDLEKNVPDFLMKSISSAWIGKIGEKYYSVVLPVSVTDYDAYKALEDGENIFLVSKVREINQDLDRLSYTVLLFFVIVYAVIFLVLKFFYPLKKTLKIVSVPLLIVLSVSAFFALFGVKLEFFSITGMILVFGLGLDYIIYMVENGSSDKVALSDTAAPSVEKISSEESFPLEKVEQLEESSDSARLECFAIFLSFITTAVSFGSLALSSFVPVHMIGLSIFIGLTTAFAATFLYKE